jgi:hypothetical protein
VVTAALLATLLLATNPLPVAANGPDAAYSFNNGFLRFGKVDGLSNPGVGGPTATRESVNAGGLLDTPYYFSPTAVRWYQLTFSERALDLAVGAGRCVGDLVAPPDQLDLLRVPRSRQVLLAPQHRDGVLQR